MKKVLLGLSGGIDSAVSALILKEMGYEVTGCFLMLTEGCDLSSAEAKSARAAAEFLGIKLVEADFRSRFRENVTAYFINEYLSGKTPNPCIMCNPTTKIRSLIDTADSLGIYNVATGHYAKTACSEKYGGTVLMKAASKKDQSYFLSRLSPAQTERLIFPLGAFSSKDEVREYAKKAGLPNSEKPDSQEICFIPDNDYAKYICNNTDFIPDEGNFIDINGNTLGKHSGIINYTVGQRKGLGAFGEPRYVKEINARENTVTLCKKDERFTDTVLTECPVWTINKPVEGAFDAQVKIRSTAPAVNAHIIPEDRGLRIVFTEKVISASPGQTAAIYDGDTVLGSAFIL